MHFAVVHHSVHSLCSVVSLYFGGLIPAVLRLCCELHRGIEGRTERTVSWRGLAHIQYQLSRHLTFITTHQYPVQRNLSVL